MIKCQKKHDGENILAYLDFSGNDHDNLSKLILVNKVLNGLNTMILNNREKLINEYMKYFCLNNVFRPLLQVLQENFRIFFSPRKYVQLSLFISPCSLQ